MARPATSTSRLLAGSREPVRVATTGNIDPATGGLLTIDDVQVEPGDRVLVKSQADKTTNGIYGASAGEWYRASDGRSPRSINKGTMVSVQEGTANAGKVYAFQTLEPAIGTDEILIGAPALVGVLYFESKLQAESSTIDDTLNSIMLTGYYNAGDGGMALYRKVEIEPAHNGKLQSADGAWWEIAETILMPQMFGARGDGVTNDTVAIQNAIDAAGPSNAVVYFPRGHYVAVGLVINPIRAANSFVINNPHLKGDGGRNSIIMRPPGTNGHLLTLGFIDANPTSGGSYRAAQTRISGLGFKGYESLATATTGHSINVPDGNATAPNTGYGYAPWLDDVYLDGSPQLGLFVGLYRNFGFFNRVVGLFTKASVVAFVGGNGDHTFIECVFGSPGSSGVDTASFYEVFSSKFFGCDFHGGNNGSACVVTGTDSYLGFTNCVFNDNDHYGIAIYGSGVVTDNPVTIIDCMFSDNSKAVHGGYHDILVSSRYNVAISNCKFVVGAPGNLPAYHVLRNGNCGKIVFDGNITAITGTAGLGVTNAPLLLTGAEQVSATVLSQANVTCGSGALTTASGNMYARRHGNTISLSVAFYITTNGTGAVDLRFPLPYGTATYESFGTGEEIGVANTPLIVKVAAGAAFLTVRKMVAGFTYPGVNGASMWFSISYMVVD